MRIPNAQIPLKEKFSVLLLKIFSRLPLKINRLIGRFIGRIAWLLSNKQRHFTLTNIQHCLPELDKSKATALARATLISGGELVTELAITWLAPIAKRQKFHLEIEGEQWLHQAHAKGKGVLLFTPHLGNWELLPQFILPQYPFVAMYKPARMKSLDILIKTNREKEGAALYPASATGIKQLLKAIKSGSVTAILPDQEPAKSAGIFVSFFNQPAWTMVLAARIYQKTQAEVLATCVLRTKKGFKLIMQPIPELSVDKTTAEISLKINQAMESLIRLAPAQYQWSYKRFYTQPDGKPQIYLQ